MTDNRMIGSCAACGMPLTAGHHCWPRFTPPKYERLMTEDEVRRIVREELARAAQPQSGSQP